MARLTDVQRSALGYWWDLVVDAARLGNTVTDAVAAASTIAADLNTSLSPDENRAISTLFGYARRIENAGTALQSAQAEKFIDATMIATPPWARDEQEMNTTPNYHVKFTYTYLDQAGNIQTTTKTSVFPDVLPATVGELTADILDDAEAMAAKYGHTLLSAVPLQILAV